MSSLNVTLASSLLDLEFDQGKATAAAGGNRWITGIPSLDKATRHDLWTSGTIVGIGSIDSDNSSGSLNISHELIANHLLEQHRARSKSPSNETLPHSVSIIAPPAQATSSIQHIHSLLAARLARSSTPADPTPLLTAISLLQYLDLPGVLEALAEISSPDPSAPPRRRIILLSGLTILLRRRCLTQTAALFSTLLTTLRNTVRGLCTYGPCLALIELPVSWSRGAAQDLSSAFSSVRGHVLGVHGHGTVGGMVVGGCDVVVAVHDADGRERRAGEMVVEVVKDERGGVGVAGNKRGVWCVWEGGR